LTTELNPTRFGSGQAVRRLEDESLLAGAGRYTDDVTLPDQAHLVFLRSPYPHARIVSIDTSTAAAMPGVLRVITGAELAAAGSSRCRVPRGSSARTAATAPARRATPWRTNARASWARRWPP
jgi:CO/xanthine dehydrogenase Mo-binding subunit